MDRELYEITFEEFVGPHPRVLSDQEVAEDRLAQESLKRISVDLETYRSFFAEAYPIPYATGYRIASGTLQDKDSWPHMPQNFVIAFDEATGDPIGGMFRGTIWVDPDHRGMGLGSEILLKALQDPENHTVADGAYFSESGFANRRSAHRKAVDRAIESGFAVPDAVRFECGYRSSLTQSLADRLDGTCAVDPDGRPLILYHATFAQFDRFEKTRDVGFHFGGLEQAKRHVRNECKDSFGVAGEERYIPVALTAQAPLVMHHDPRAWNLNQLAIRWRHIIGRDLSDRLVEMHESALNEAAQEIDQKFGKISERSKSDDKKAVDAFSDIHTRKLQPAFMLLREALLDAGYDSIAYANVYETRKHRKPIWRDYSWVALTDDVIITLPPSFMGAESLDVPQGIAWAPSESPVQFGLPDDVMPDKGVVSKSRKKLFEIRMLEALEDFGFDSDTGVADTIIGEVKATLAEDKIRIDACSDQFDEEAANRVMKYAQVFGVPKPRWVFSWQGGETPERVVERLQEFAEVAGVEKREALDVAAP